MDVDDDREFIEDEGPNCFSFQFEIDDAVADGDDQHYGDAVRNMIINQTLYSEQPDNDIPLLNMDGEKAQTIINAYRQPASEKLEKAKQGVAFDAKSVGGTTN